jgi:hypothetical protein
MFVNYFFMYYLYFFMLLINSDICPLSEFVASALSHDKMSEMAATKEGQ